MRSLKSQLIVSLLVGVLVCSALAALALYRQVREEADELFDYQLQQIAASFHGDFIPKESDHGEGELEEDTVIQVWDDIGRVIYRSSPTRELPQGTVSGFSDVTSGGQQWRVFDLRRRSRLIQVAQPDSARASLVDEFALRSLLPFVFLPVLLALVIAVIVDRTLLPLKTLTRAIGERTSTTLAPVSLGRPLPTELQPLIEALNDLLGRLDTALSAQRAFVADAAHELRSPLTALSLQLQLWEQAGSDKERSNALGKMKLRLERAIHVVEQLLALARNETAPESEAESQLDLGEVVSQAVAESEDLAASRSILLSWEKSVAPVAFYANPDALTVLVSNLIDNAVRYTLPGGQVSVEVGTSDHGPWIQVADTGPGISEQERTRIFDRFYRIPGSSDSGSGMGLAIVKTIAGQYGIRIELSSNTPRGLVVRLQFPVSGPRS